MTQRFWKRRRVSNYFGSVFDALNPDDKSLLMGLQARAEELKAMPAGWDSYNGESIDHATADKAVEVAMALAPLFPTYPPQIVPAGDGTVQVEIHADGFDIEAWVNRETGRNL